MNMNLGFLLYFVCVRVCACTPWRSEDSIQESGSLPLGPGAGTKVIRFDAKYFYLHDLLTIS